MTGRCPSSLGRDRHGVRFVDAPKLCAGRRHSPIGIDADCRCRLDLTGVNRIASAGLRLVRQAGRCRATTGRRYVRTDLRSTGRQPRCAARARRGDRARPRFGRPDRRRVRGIGRAAIDGRRQRLYRPARPGAAGCGQGRDRGGGRGDRVSAVRRARLRAHDRRVRRGCVVRAGASGRGMRRGPDRDGHARTPRRAARGARQRRRIAGAHRRPAGAGRAGGRGACAAVL